MSKYFKCIGLISILLQLSIIHAGVILDDFETTTDPGKTNYVANTSLGSYSDWAIVQGTATISTDDFQSGSQSVKLVGGTSLELDRDLTSVLSDPVYADFYVKLVAHDIPPLEILSINESSLWFIKSGSDGFFHVLNGDGSGGVGTSFDIAPLIPLDASDRSSSWVRLSFRQDFSAGVWDIYVDGQLEAVNLGFKNSITSSTTLTLYGDDTTDAFLDTFSLSDTHPLFTDLDKDGMDDIWETTHTLNTSANDRNVDQEPDGLTNIEEFLYNTDPRDSDSDNDGFTDDIEVAVGTDPNSAASIPSVAYTGPGPSPAISLRPEDSSKTLLFVNGLLGSDLNDGSSDVNQGNSVGPFKTIGQALSMAVDGTVVFVASAIYFESSINTGTRDISFRTHNGDVNVNVQ